MGKTQKLLEIVADIIEIDDVTLETQLDDESWDSLAVVSFISEADNEFDKVVSPTEVNKATKVADLLELIK